MAVRNHLQGDYVITKQAGESLTIALIANNVMGTVLTQHGIIVAGDVAECDQSLLNREKVKALIKSVVEPELQPQQLQKR